jgi:glutathione S-transferase
MQLYIGNKNYSSWSMRPWLLMHEFEIPFEECRVRFDSFEPDSVFKRTLAALTPTGRVPVLVDDDGFIIWDTLAIAEFLAERHADRPLWPVAARQRARARSLCAEMHSGFGALRQHLPVNIEARLPEVGAMVLAREPAVANDIARIDAMWSEQIRLSGGPFLFGAYSIADAFYAPVCTRLRTYGIPVGPDTEAYMERIFATRSMRRWVAEALAEKDFLGFEEPYRSAPSASP